MSTLATDLAPTAFLGFGGRLLYLMVAEVEFQFEPSGRLAFLVSF